MTPSVQRLRPPETSQTHDEKLAEMACAMIDRAARINTVAAIDAALRVVKQNDLSPAMLEIAMERWRSRGSPPLIG